MKSVLPILAFVLLAVSSCKKQEDEEPKPNQSSGTTQYNYIASSIFPYKIKRIASFVELQTDYYDQPKHFERNGLNASITFGVLF